MKLNRVSTVFAIILVCATSGIIYARKHHTSRFQGRTHPDMQTRMIASKIIVSEIDCIRIRGPHMGIISYKDSIKVRDRVLIQKFVDSLRQSTTTTPIGIGNGVDGLEVHFKIVGGKRRGVEYFPFNAQNTQIWYGPKFADALNQLSDFQAMQVRQRVNWISSSQINFVKFGSFKTVKKKEIQHLLHAIRKVDRRAYAYTENIFGIRGSNFQKLQMVMNNGKTLDFQFVPSAVMPNNEVEPLWRLHGLHPKQ